MKKLKDLIDKFDSNKKEYKNSDFNETQTRIVFIDPFFEILGWDMKNHSQVIHEDRLKVDGKTKAPDYGMVINGSKRLFYVEAKKPSVDIQNSKDPAFQIKRYAYTAKLPVSIVTDFEEFAIYDTSRKPDNDDKANKSRIFFCRYDDYLKPLDNENHNRFKKEFDIEFKTNFELINHFFSKSNAYKGSLDVFKKKISKGHKTIDDEILEDVEEWRKLLAENIAKHNISLDAYQLNEAVQKILDRIIFLRMAEDRQTEEYLKLKNIVAKDDVYRNLVEYFKNSNKKYNSGLFKPEDYIDTLEISNNVFKRIVKDLYYPKPYEFSILPIETLGHIYEQFLGKTITINDKNKVVIELKPEVRKAGGVYYTPEYIVKYIVENTVGEKIKKKTPKEIESLTVLDPACGSGSFLIGAYQYLLDFHLNYYIDDTKKYLRENVIYDIGEKEYKLTFREKRRILLNNIYGVDIDSQAVEVTKLSLLLKMMEGEILESNDELFSQNEGILPNLENNIKCGNSLIESAFYENNFSLFGDKEKRRSINTFDWKSDDGFKNILSKGGFDCIIGNPPYAGQKSNKELLQMFNSGFWECFYERKQDIYYYFYIKSILLAKENGYISMITPHYWLTAESAGKIRDFISKNTTLIEILDCSTSKVFKDASVNTMVYTFIKSIEDIPIKIKEIILNKDNDSYIIKNEYLSIVNIKDLGLEVWNIFKNNSYVDILNKGLKLKLLKDLSTISPGIQTGCDKVGSKHIKILNIEPMLKNAGIYVINKNEYSKFNKSSNIFIKPWYKNSAIDRYYYKPKNDSYVIITNSIKNLSLVPELENHLLKFKTIIDSRYKNFALKNAYELGRWWYLYGYRPNTDFIGEKIVFPYRGHYPKFTYTDNEFYASIDVFYITRLENTSFKYILGILNSKLIHYFLDKNCKKKGDVYEFYQKPIGSIPIKTLNLDNSEESLVYKKLIGFVDDMLIAQNELNSSNLITETDRKLARQKVGILDKQINKIVYELYELTDDEIKIVEESTKIN